MMETPLDATRLAERIIQLLAEPFEIEGHQIVIGVSLVSLSIVSGIVGGRK
jgi:hypothetical protein